MSLTPAQIHEARRRKVRKGTHSCWECRRRKIRCQFASPDDAVCIGCRARGSACRSQEFADEMPAPSQQVPEKKVAQRLDRLESMMEQLMTHVMAGPSQQSQQTRASEDGGPRNTSPSNHTQQHGHQPSSTAPSDAGDASLTHISLLDQSCRGDEEAALDQVHQIYKDPSEIVAHVCPTAAAKQGYGMLDVLDTSTADDTPVAALLGIQDTLSGANGGGSGGESTPNYTHGAPPAGSHDSGAASVAAVLCVSANALIGGTQSPGSMDTSANSPNGSTAGASHDARGTLAGSASGTSDTAATAATTATKDSASLLYTAPFDPVSEEWRRHQHLSRLLVSLFPTQEDIVTITAGPPTQYLSGLFYSKHDIAAGRAEPLTKLREVPAMTGHPTAIARRLLQLTLCMQQMAPCFVLQKKLHLTEPLSDVINRIAGVVSHTVTSNDELIGSVEGLECLVLLGEQQSNAGQLRKAWLSYRRAMSLAQLMGLDRGNTRALKSCDPTSDPRTRPTPAAMWYRINACDRYVSLLLGLRAGSQDDDSSSTPRAAAGGRAASPNSPQADDDVDTPVETLEKAHMILTGRIIERNHGKISLEQSYAVTQAIDADLQAAASRNLGPTWWEVPSYDPYARPDFIFNEMSRSILQVHHHCILILLHLPYMLRGEHPAAAAARMMAASTSATTSQCEKSMEVVLGNSVPEAESSGSGSGTSPPDERRSCSGGLAYSKATCLQSSRAVLRRFVHFRLIVNTAFSCRHVDYASLIAAMTLIIGYLGPRPAPTSDPNILDAFDTQLRQDRAMVEQVRERMEYIGKVNNDKLSRESAATIQHLMPILDLVAKKPEPVSDAVATTQAGPSTAPDKTAGDLVEDGMRTNTASSPYPGSVGNISPGIAAGTPSASGTGSSVRLNVPYFGTVNIHTDAATGMSSMAPHYAQPPQTPFQQQQRQQQLHHDLSMPPGASSASPSTANPAVATLPVSYDLFTSPTTGHPVLDWSGNVSQAHPSHTPQQQHQQQPDAVDPYAMLVDFDPMPMADDGSGAPGGPDLFGFGGGAAFPDMTGSGDDWVMQGVDTTYWSLLNGGGGSFGGQMG